MDKILKIYDVLKQNKKHHYYNRTVYLANLYKTLITGEGMNNLMKRFVRREDEESFKQRCEITKHIVPSICSNLMDVAYKIPRTNNVKRIIKHEKQDKGQLLEQKILMFDGDVTVDGWLETRFIELSYQDPNAYVIIDFKPFDYRYETATPYPFEAKSENVIYYEKDNNILDFIIVKTVKGYTYYDKEQAIVLIERKQGKTTDAVEKNEDTYIITANGRTYDVIMPEPYNLSEVPAYCVGYKRDILTDGQTYINPFHAAIPLLEKTIKANSELDLTMSIHAFPQKIQHTQPCDNLGCVQGRIIADNSVCPACKGTGTKIVTSTNEAITIPLPEIASEAHSLDNIVKYIYPPTDILTFQKEYIDEITRKAKAIVFNTDIFDKAEVSETATGKNIDIQNVYDMLYPFACKYQYMYEKIIYTIADIIDVWKDGSTELFVSLRFGKDFKLKTKSDLLDELTKARTAGANTDIIRRIESDIVMLDNTDNINEYQLYEIKSKLNPFANKTQNEILIILSSSVLTSEINKIIYANIDYIITELREKYEYLTEMPFAKIKEAAYEIANNIMSENVAEI